MKVDTPLFGTLARAQYAAVLQMRWRMLLNSLRSKRGRMELGARIFVTCFFAAIWLGLGSGFGYAAHQFVVQGQFRGIVILFWAILAIWQIFPIMVASAQESIDLGLLLRFPVSFGSYMLLYVFLGLFDLATLLGGISLLGLGIGLVTAQPSLTVWVVPVLSLFALFNLLLTRAIFAWIERWLAQRRTREILGMVFLALFLGLQLLNPALRRTTSINEANNEAKLFHALKIADTVQQFFPPGIAAGSLEAAAAGHRLDAIGLLGVITLYAIGAAAALGLRLRAEHRGENLGEAPASARRPKEAMRPMRISSASATQRRPWLNGPIAAVLAKELRYLSRSGVLLFSLISPLVILFMIGGQSRSGHGAPPFHLAFPIAAAYGFLPLTRILCNSLGGEGAGIQLYFLSPTPFRTVMLAKNLLQTGLFCLELVLAVTISIVRFGPPPLVLGIATICWLLFALPANLALGNILSITMAYRMTLTRLSREEGSVGSGLLSLLIQLLLFAAGAAIYLLLNAAGEPWLASPVYLALAIGAVLLWFRVLANIDRMAANRRETLIAALVRAA